MFTDLFGGAPHARVFDFLAEEPEMDHTITDISRGADVARPTVYKVLDDLVDHDVVVQTRKVGNSRLFQLNLQNRTVHDLLWVIEPELEDPALGELEAGIAEERPSSPSSRRKRST